MNWFKKLFSSTKKQITIEQWENSSPDSLHLFITKTKSYRNWTYLENNHMPHWIRRIARRIDEHSKTPVYIHRRFISYKIDYNDHEGVIVFKGIKPLKQMSGIRRKYQ